MFTWHHVPMFHNVSMMTVFESMTCLFPQYAQYVLGMSVYCSIFILIEV